MKQRLILLTTPLILAATMLLAAFWLFSPSPVQAASHIVGGSCGATIQACIDSVAAGDTVVVPAGTWNESLTLNRPISLTGVSSATTIIQALPGQRVLSITGATIGSNVVVADLTLANGDISGGNVCFPDAINCGGGLLIASGAQPSLSRLIIANNQAYRGGGLYADAGSVLNLNQVVFRDNSAILSGGGASFADAVTIHDSLFEDNRSTNNVGGGLRTSGNITVVNTVFRGNESSCPSQFSICHAGGLYGFEVNVSIEDSLFENNSCDGDDCDGGGLYLSSSFVDITLSLTNTEFISNTAGRHGGGAVANSFRVSTNVDGGRFERNQARLGDGGGLHSYRAVITGTRFFSNTTGATNTFDDGGGGLKVRTSAVITNALFSGNHSDRGGGGLAVFLGPVSLTNSRFISNTAQENGGGAYVELNGATVTNSQFENNRTLVPEIINDDNVGNGGGFWVSGNTTLRNVTLNNNVATNRGGGLFMAVGGAATITVNNSLIQNNQALGTEFFGDGGGGFNLGNNSIIVNDSQFLNNQALPAGGGGIYLSGAITDSNSLFQGNQALFGGGLYAANANITTSFDGTQFIANAAVNTGGGAMTAGSARFTNVLFQQNSSTGTGLGQGFGGGLRASEPITLTNVQFISNTAAGGSGGGIAAFTAVSVTNTLFQGNSSAGSGGGLSGSFDLIRLTNVQFISNAAALNGGGLQSSGNIHILDSQFQLNGSEGNGGALYTSGSIWITNTTVTSNTASGDGGGLYINSNLRAEDILVAGNSSGGNGGGIYEGSIISRFQDNVIRDNQAQGDGGGIYARFRVEADSGNLFEGNIAGGAGGGLYVGRQWLILADSLFINNQAEIGGGLIMTTTFSGSTGSSLVNILFAGNAASTDGAAIYYNSTRPIDIIHNTFADTTENGRTAIDVHNGTVLITNTIIANHRVGLANNGGSVTANFNLYFGNSLDQFGVINGNIGNVSGDPQFVDPAAADYHIGPGAAIDNGTNAGVAVDFEGDGRPIGAGFDIGFDEAFVDLAINKTVAPAGPVQPGAAITYTLTFTNEGSSLAQSVRITDTLPATLTNVSFSSSGAAVTQTNAGVMTYTWQVADLAAGAGGVITVTGIVSPGLNQDTTINNSAAIGSSSLDIDPADNQAQAVFSVVVPRLALANATYSVNEGTGTALLTVVLDRIPLADVTVVYSTSDVTARAGSDYAGARQRVTIPTGSTQGSLTITILDDDLVEFTEELLISLTGPSGALLISPTQATLTILDNDATTVDFDQSAYSVVEDSGLAIIPVALSNPAVFTITVDYATGAGSATPSDDYTTTSGTLQYAPGVTSQNINIPISADLLDELNETLVITLTNAVSATIGSNNPATLTILDDDDPPTIGFSQANFTVSEGSVPALVTVTLSALSGLDIQANYASSDGSASAGSDYSAVSGLMTIPAGSTVTTFTVPILDDTLYENPETFALTLSSLVNASAGANSSATVTISDDDPPPQIAFSAAAYQVDEADMSVTITITLNTVSALDTQIAYATMDGTAEAGADYSAVSDMATIPAGQLRATFTVGILEDAFAESDESVILMLSSPINGLIGTPAPATLVILDNDGAGVTINPIAGLATSEAGGTDSFDVVLRSEPTAPVTITLTSSDPTEGIVSPMITFDGSNWDTPQTVTVTGVNDDIDDGDLPYSVQTSVSSADPLYAGIDPADVNVTNIDDDSAGVIISPTLGLITTEAGGGDTFTVVLTSEPTAVVTITVASSDPSEGTISPALRFNSSNWATPQHVSITGVDDDLADGDVAYTIETGVVSGDPVYAAIDPTDVNVINLDDETAGILVNPTVISVTEGSITATYTISLTSQPTDLVTITLSLGDQIDVSTNIVTFTPQNWDQGQPVIVRAIYDNIFEGPHSDAISHTVSSNDLDYDGLAMASVAVSITDRTWRYVPIIVNPPVYSTTQSNSGSLKTLKGSFYVGAEGEVEQFGSVRVSLPPLGQDRPGHHGPAGPLSASLITNISPWPSPRLKLSPVRTKPPAATGRIV